MIGSSLLLIAGLVILFTYLYPHVTQFIVINQISVPQTTSIWPILIYFFSVVVVLGIVLFLIPVSKLKIVLRLIFALLYAWGILIVLGPVVTVWVSLPVAVAAGAVWFMMPRVWLQNILLLLTLVSIGVVFGQGGAALDRSLDFTGDFNL